MEKINLTVKEKIVKISNEIRIGKDGNNPFQNFAYFRPDDIARAINPLMEKYGLIIIFNMIFNAESKMYQCNLIIENIDSDEKIEYKYDTPLTSVKGSSEAQGAGATMTYARRYMIQNAFNLAENDLDLDSMNGFKKEIHKEFPKLKEAVTNKDGVCPECEGIAKYREGVKNQKRWQGWFCQNKKCNHVVWGPKFDENKAQAEQEEAESLPIIEDEYQTGIEDNF